MAIKIKPFQFKKLEWTGLSNETRGKEIEANTNFLKEDRANLSQKELNKLKLPYPEAVPICWALYVSEDVPIAELNDVGKFDVNDCGIEERPLPTDCIKFYMSENTTVGTGTSGDSKAILYSNQFLKKSKESLVVGYREVTVGGNKELWMDLVKTIAT